MILKPELMMPKSGFRVGGIFKIEIFEGWYNKKIHKVVSTGELISSSWCHNVVTNEGINHMLNVELWDTAKIATWYNAIFADDYTPLITNTYAVPGYTEWETYDEATRPEYETAESVAKSITNSANKSVFTANAGATLYGASVLGDNTKGDEAGGSTLFSSGVFAVAQPVIDTNVVNLTYTNTGADDGV